MIPISQGRYRDLIGGFADEAWRWEIQPRFRLSHEDTDLALWRAGTPRPPAEAGWGRDWLGQVAAHVAAGRRISRVRVVAEPPTEYQQWAMWAGRWNIAAGEDIRYLTASQADRAGLPGGDDWWLLDGRHVVVMHYDDGRPAGKWLITGRADVARYRSWRDTAVALATEAARDAAA